MERYSDPNRIYTYSYRSISHSLFDKVNKYWLNYAFRFVPPTMSPNLLSMIGNIGSWISLIIMVSMGSSHGSHHRHLFAIASFSVFFYHTVDNLDGRQARRIGCTGPLGEFIDHWFDSFNVFFFPLSIMAAFSVIPLSWAIALVLLASLADWLTLREVMKTNVMYFGPVSTDEGIFVVWGFLGTVAVTGYEFWATSHPVLGFPPIFLLIAIYAVSCSAVIIRILITYRGMGVINLLVQMAMLAPVVFWIYTAVPIFGRQVSLVTGLFVIGFSGSRHVGDLLRARLTGLKNPLLYPDLALCSLFVLAVTILFRSTLEVPALVLLLPMVVMLVDIIQALIVQFFRTVRRVYDCLGIPLFNNQPSPEVIAVESLRVK